jgi:hypothetical protein
MISPKGQVKLLDFGIAKNTDTNSAEYTQTSTSQQMGTPMYMSPEQVNETKSVTAQSDIYSLGVVLWQMVMGQKPYDIKTLSTFQLQSKIVNENLALTNTSWDASIQKATHKNLDSRYTSAQLFLNDLQNPAAVKIDKTAFKKNDDKTIFENKEEATIIENNISKEIKCPRCLGKGEVDWEDIKRLNRLNDWDPGPCAYCDQEGKVLESKALQVAPNGINLVYEDPLSDGFYGGHIDDLEEFIEVVVSSFDEDYLNVKFNGELDYFNNSGWGALDNNLLDKFSIPTDVQEKISIIAHYEKLKWALFSTKSIEVYFAAYTKFDDERVESNLLFISTDSLVYTFSLSVLIDGYEDLGCISSLEVHNDILKINSYCLEEGQMEGDKRTDYYDEIKLNPEICQFIAALYNEIDSRGLI